MASTTATPLGGTEATLEVRPTSDSHFGWLRTKMAADRTLMAWVRTAVSMIGFGFTIVQFFERFQKMEGVAEALRPGAPRYLGLSLMAAGTLALLVSTWQYHVLSRYLEGPDFRPISGKGGYVEPGYLIALVMLLIGVFAFVAVLTRMV